MNIDHLFSRRYHIDNYNCVHFLCEAWQAMFGEDLSGRMQAFLVAINDIKPSREAMQQFKRLKEPISPCIVLFKDSKSSHVGLFYRRKVLHITRNGVQRVPLDIAKVGFKHVRFYQ